MTSVHRIAAALLLVGAASALLTACAPDDHQLAPGSTDSVQSQDSTLDPNADPVNEAIGINCQTLISDQDIYTWGSGNFALDVDFVPQAGTPAAQIASTGGLACSWVNLTSGETVDIAVASLTESELEQNESVAAEGSTAVDGLGTGAYFRADGVVGQMDIFTDSHWITAESGWFLEPGDATPLLEPAVAALAALG